jgi:co-chaperonin GroES (HSP10)
MRLNLDPNKLRPTRGKILLRRIPPETESEGGIALPNSVNPRRSLYGEVIAVGAPEIVMKTGKRVPIEVEKGQTVRFEPGEWQGPPFDVDWEVNGEIYTVIDAKRVVLVLE